MAKIAPIPYNMPKIARNMPKLPPIPLDKPTRPMIMAAFREIGRLPYYSTNKIGKLSKAVENKEKELLLDPHYLQLQKEYKAARKVWQKIKKDFINKVDTVRREYLAKGGTPAILKKIAALVDKYNELFSSITDDEEIEF